MIQRSQQRRGVILVLVLWMVVLLSLIAYSVLFQVCTETGMTTQRRNYLKAEMLARAGTAKAVIDLKNDMLYDTAEGEDVKDFDGEGDVWARPEEEKDEFALADEKFSGNKSDGTYSVRVQDEESRFNINRINHANRKLLQTIMEHIGYSEDDAELAATAVVDWRDRDYQPGLADSPDNDEGIAYAMLFAEAAGEKADKDEVKPMVFRNEDFLTVEEMLEVPGITPDIFFGPKSPEAEYYNKVHPAPKYGDRFKVESKDRHRRDEPILGLRDYFTVYGNGSLNMNTALPHVLDAFAITSGAGEEGFGEDLVDSRRGGAKDDITNDDMYKDMTELMADGDAASVIAAGRNFYNVGIKSSTFRIVSVGVVGDVKCRMESLAIRESADFTRDEQFEYGERADETREDSEERRVRRENRDDENKVKYPFVRIIQSYKD